jgi:alkylhydroperoxidase/carboxymuconolactone decarboxylase family protein YurZ
MRKLRATPVSIVAVSLLMIAVPGSTQPAGAGASAGLNDPEFWAIVQNGPSDSRELETLVTVYAANGMAREARQAFIDYLTDRDRTQDSHCNFCVALLSEPEPGELGELFMAATDEIVERGDAQRSGEHVLRVALVVAGGNTRTSHDYAMYLLTAAVQLGVDDESLQTVVRTLALLGENATARTLAKALYDHPSSVYHESPEMRSWVQYLDSEVARREQIAATIVAMALQ